MLFRRIAVRNFRKLVSPVVIEGLGEGVTIIAGDNEEGKSTLLAAIRTGLFERHNLSGKSAEDMQPYGSSVRPEIQLDFEIDGKTYSITKGFAQKPSARLTTPDGKFEGPAADERLAELLNFRIAQRGESKPDDQGILGLFWLEQGHVLGGLAFGETGRSTLRKSLEEEVGDVLGGIRGRRLLEAAKTKRDELLTPKKGDPAGQLKEAIATAREALARVTGLELKRLEYDQDTDELARLRRELARIKSDRVLEKTQDELANLEKQAKEIEALRQQDEAAGQAAALAKAELENIRNRRIRRKELIAALAHKESALKSAQATLENLDAATKDVAGQFGTADAALATAAAASHDAEARVIQSETGARLAGLDREIADIEQHLEAADSLSAQRTKAQERLASIKIDKKAFERIESLGNDVRETQAALGAIATRVCFLPSARQVIRKDDEGVLAEEEMEVTEAAHFTLEGFGGVEVAPGASDLAVQRARLKAAEGTLNRALAAAGVQTVSQAKSQLAERTEAEAAVRDAERLIAVHAPKGIEALRNAHKEKVLERDRLAKNFDPSVTPDLGDPETERRAQALARAAEKTAEDARDAAQKKQQDHNIAVAVAKGKLVGAKEDAGAAKGELEAARAETSDAALSADLEQAQDTLGGKERRKAETGRQLAAANPEEVELRRQRAKETLQTVEADERQLREQAITTQSRLEALGQNGIGEHLDIARGAKDQAIARRDRLQADANAWALLVTTLESAEREAKEAFVDPVLKRVDPFLRLLLPEVSIKLDEETLKIKGIARDGRVEPYGTLSIGTREQLSILVRLAFAVYLREKDYPAAVILDDALVYADDGRFERMQLALRKAAETVQILILTCRARDWRNFGAPIRRLADGRAKAFSIPPATNE